MHSVLNWVIKHLVYWGLFLVIPKRSAERQGGRTHGGDGALTAIAVCAECGTEFEHVEKRARLCS